MLYPTSALTLNWTCLTSRLSCRKVNSVLFTGLLLYTLAASTISPRLIPYSRSFLANPAWSPEWQVLATRRIHSSSPTKPNTYQPQTRSLPNAHLNHRLRPRDHEPIHAQHSIHQYLPPVVRPSHPLSPTRHQGSVPRYRERLLINQLLVEVIEHLPRQKSSVLLDQVLKLPYLLPLDLALLPPPNLLLPSRGKGRRRKLPSGHQRNERSKTSLMILLSLVRISLGMPS